MIILILIIMTMTAKIMIISMILKAMLSNVISVISDRYEGNHCFVIFFVIITLFIKNVFTKFSNRFV